MVMMISAAYRGSVDFQFFEATKREANKQEATKREASNFSSCSLSFSEPFTQGEASLLILIR